MRKGLISIFAMPQEIDDLHILLYNVKRSMVNVTCQMDIHITFCVSDELTDWSKTPLPKQYFIDKFNSLRPLMDWSKNPKIKIENGNNILGCVSQRRDALRYVDDYDFTIWLDCDIFLSDSALFYITSTYQSLRANGDSNFIVTPQFVRQWDSTWDMIVDERYLDKPLMYHEQADIITDVLQEHDDISVSMLDGFKFAGGWVTLIDNSLLKFIGIPESLGHYGLEDTFIVEACKILSKGNHEITPVQYLVKNYLVGENYLYRCNDHLKSFVTSRNRKEEFRAVATANFGRELMKFKERVGL